ncbi:hypothetical protein Scep_016868 [Stephania cephalantha]|uniref:Uncharacterized protein n=1 Tax=Stephania cephalantha TaxID=152367 RepID=A0AAP0IP04_9MAGN
MLLNLVATSCTRLPSGTPLNSRTSSTDASQSKNSSGRRVPWNSGPRLHHDSHRCDHPQSHAARLSSVPQHTHPPLPVEESPTVHH